MSQEELSIDVSQIKDNLDRIHSEMKKAAQKAGRDVDEIKLIAVTKLMPLKMIKAGIEAGIRRFGENYPEQAAEKILALPENKNIEWHMIGHIQSRKSDTVCQYFQMVHSLDRMKIARYLDRYCEEMNKVMPVLVEVNVSGEDSKFGWSAWKESHWPELLSNLRKISTMKHIKIIGLMTMPPLFDDPQKTRPYYQCLGTLRNFLRNELPEIEWKELSIGTSFDYQVAIEEGSTMIRLGTEIFGPRPAN